MMLDKDLYDVDILECENLGQVPFPVYESGQEPIENAIQSELNLPCRKALIYFGSAKTTMKKRNEYYARLAEALYRLNYQTMIIDRESESIPHAMFVEYLPFDKVLGSFDVVIHHGGIGTAMQCLVQDVPQLIVPQMLDQFFWADVFTKRGFGARLNEVNDIVKYINDDSLEGMKNAAARYSAERTQINAEEIYISAFS
jgi:UDP:flavonoid glycosyltransferase YjiC (YdhE family)